MVPIAIEACRHPENRCSPSDVAYLLLRTQAPEQVAVVMDDGFNVVQYTFHLQAVGPESTSVLCEVRCC